MTNSPLDEQIAELVKLGDDAYEDNTILLFKIQFPGNSKIYSYTALKADNRWFLSGAHAREAKTWAELLNMLIRRGTVIELSRVTQTEIIYPHAVLNHDPYRIHPLTSTCISICWNTSDHT